ncbi:hypothetical protein COS83_00125 [archaeon CG07_land_8_20_14_0_80_38_8]|nr:MAG: hypothetical protein COS83_00125 [archaeon CG07_land_8_20_14_0_80_38_8]PIU88745.1 MAG: hypothetical protein COS64_02570 [archaeon CG06_land_8_20_14_3_00_37_11]
MSNTLEQELKNNTFKINDYITLKLEKGKTNIYVKGELFQQCKYLLLQIPTDEVKETKNIDSIDEAAGKYSNELEGKQTVINYISPEEEFRGHCSNLQAWAENDYDTRLLHSNLSFPLLKKLVEAGDSLANKVFKDELCLRLTAGYEPVIEYLTKEKYLNNFTEEEKIILLEDQKQLNNYLLILNTITKEKIRNKILQENLEQLLTNKENQNITTLKLNNYKLAKIPETIEQLKNLKYLDLGSNQITTIPDSITQLKNLQELYLYNNQLTQIPETIEQLKNLKYLDLGSNQITTLPDWLEKMKRKGIKINY